MTTDLSHSGLSVIASIICIIVISLRVIKRFLNKQTASVCTLSEYPERIFYKK